MEAVVPALRVPALTALETAVCRLATVSPAAAVKTNLPPVCASVMEVLEPAVRAVVVASDAWVEEKEFGALEEKTLTPLKSVVWPIWLTSERIDWNSVSRAAA